MKRTDWSVVAPSKIGSTMGHLLTIRQKIELLRNSGAVADQILDEIWHAALGLHDSIASGRGKASLAEENVARWTAGVVCSRYDSGHDVISNKGNRLEVKFSKLNTPNRSRDGSARRWNWTNLLGGSMSRKDYDWLILVGERDERFQDRYPPFEEGFVVFAIPRADVETEATRLRLSPAARGTIALSSDPALNHTNSMIARYAVSEADLAKL